MKHLLLLAAVLASLSVSSAEEDRQKWSIHTKLGGNVELTCNDSYPYPQPIVVQPDDTLSWRKRDEIDNIAANAKFEFTAMYGINKMMLTIKDSVIEDGGIYLCDVTSSSGELRGTIVKGLNLGTYDHDDKLNEYEDGIIVGFIAAGSTIVLVVGVGLLDHFRYQSAEEKQKRKDWKNLQKEKQQRWKDDGHHNLGADLDMPEGVTKTGEPLRNGEAAEYTEANTHL